MAVTSAILIIANVSLNFKFNLRKEAEITSRGHYQEKNTAVAMGGARRRRVAERSGAMEAKAGTPDVATATCCRTAQSNIMPFGPRMVNGLRMNAEILVSR